MSICMQLQYIYFIHASHIPDYASITSSNCQSWSIMLHSANCPQTYARFFHRMYVSVTKYALFPKSAHNKASLVESTSIANELNFFVRLVPLSVTNVFVITNEKYIRISFTMHIAYPTFRHFFLSLQ